MPANSFSWGWCESYACAGKTQVQQLTLVEHHMPSHCVFGCSICHFVIFKAIDFDSKAVNLTGNNSAVA